VLQGQYRNASIDYLDSTGLTKTNGTAKATVSTQLFGIQYYGVETLDLALGAGNDTLGLTGDGAITNVSTGGGDDAIGVSSDASGNTSAGLTGNLDALAYALNIDAGTGHDHQSLDISD